MSAATAPCPDCGDPRGGHDNVAGVMVCWECWKRRQQPIHDAEAIDRLNGVSYGGRNGNGSQSDAEDDVGALGVNGHGPPPGGGAERPSVLIPFSEIVAKPIKWAWQDRIALRKLTALAGRPKVGKGLLYSDLIARVTRGSLDGDLDGPRHAILCTTEDEPGDTLKPRLLAAGADVERVSMFHMGSRDEPVPFRVPQDADALAERIREKNAALVVLDPLVEFIDGKLDSHKSQPVRHAIASLNAIVRDTDCAILVVFHLNKGSSNDPLLRHEASAAFTQVVRGGMLLGHDPDDPVGETGNRRVLAVTSTNLAATAPSLVYEISTRVVAGGQGEPITTAAIKPTGDESSATGFDMLGQRRGDDEEESALDEAEEFLRAELAPGPKLAKDMQSAARSLGIAERTLKRARRAVGVEVAKDGYQGPWKWHLNPVSQRGPSDDGPLWESDDGPLCESPVFTGDSGDGASKGGQPLRMAPFEDLGAENGVPSPADYPQTDEGFTAWEADLERGAAPTCCCPRGPAELTAGGRCSRCEGVPA